MKKGILMLVLAAIAVGSVSAQNWWDSFAPGFEENKVFVNAGIGFGALTAGYDLGLPPISASADFKLPIALPITVGPVLGLASRSISFSSSSYNYSTGGYDDYGYKFTYTDFAIGVRGMWHFNFVKNLDTYAGLALGYVINTATAEYTGDWATGKTDPTDYSYFLFGANIGARYFFTKTIGAYLEVGYSGLQFIGFGLALKF